jgi:hypothetical protein
MSQYSFEPAIGNALGGSLNPVRRNPDSENAMLDTHFKMTFTRIPNVTFWCNATNIPSISIGEVEVPNKFISLHVPGSSIRSDNLRVSFQLDENFTNWNEIYTWMQQVVPFEDFYDVLKNDANYYSNATIHCLNSAKQPNMRFVFRKLFPISLEGFDLNTMLTDSNPINITASFTYESFDIERVT